MQPPTTEQFATWLAHFGAGEFSKNNISKPDSVVTRVAASDEAGVDVIVMIRRRELAVLNYDEATRTSFVGPPVEPKPVAKPIKLTPAQKAIVAILTDKPTKVEILASKLKYRKCYGSFRERCALLVKLGVAKRDENGGYFKA